MSRYAWWAVDGLTAVTWSWMTLSILYNLATTGNLARAANPGGNHEAGFVVFMLVLSVCSALSGIRAALANPA